MRRANDPTNANERARAVTVSTPVADNIAPLPAEGASTVTGTVTESTVRRNGATAIGRFLLLRKLGEGGMGEVFSGYDEQLDRKVAIKLLHAGYAPEETQKRTLREAQALARLSHPNVVAVHEVGQIDGNVFVVMEHIDGTTLRDWQNEPNRTTEEIVYAYVMAGRGLAAVHAAGMVHRDFKPHNAMIDRQGRVRILDFGLAHARGSTVVTSAETSPASNTLASQLTADGAITGTPAYMSPEQFSGAQLDARTDQFSFCVALYQALYKKLPEPANAASWSSIPTSIPAMATSLATPPQRDDIPGHVAEAIMRGLSRVPEARFPTMDALLETLEIVPRTDPSGQSRQRLLFASLLVMTMGAWSLAPAEYFEATNVQRVVLLIAITGTFIAAVGSFIFRNTLLRNPFHRVRIAFLLIVSLAIIASRTVGIVHHETLENIVMRDMLITTTSIALSTLVLVPRVVAVWVTLAIAIAGVITLAAFPQHVRETVSFTLNAAILGFLVAWHRSAQLLPNTSPAKVDLATSTRSSRSRT